MSRRTPGRGPPYWKSQVLRRRPQARRTATATTLAGKTRRQAQGPRRGRPRFRSAPRGQREIAPQTASPLQGKVTRQASIGVGERRPPRPQGPDNALLLREPGSINLPSQKSRAVQLSVRRSVCLRVLRSTTAMDLWRTFVSFSSTDIRHYHLMCAWKAHEHIDFNFANFQLDEVINSRNPSYIKSVCRKKIRRADTFVLLIGNDTFLKTTFVQSEVEVAIEKGCRLIGVNLNDCRFKDLLCPSFFAGRGAMFVPFSSRILAKAMAWTKPVRNPALPDDWIFFDQTYIDLGYQLVGNTAVLPPPPQPFAYGNRPFWAK
jgi:hypothetical protein